MVMPLLRDWSERGKGQSSFDIMERASARFASIPDASVFVMIPPAMMGGNSSGFEMPVTDRAGQGHEALFKAGDMLLGKAKKPPPLLMRGIPAWKTLNSMISP